MVLSACPQRDTGSGCTFPSSGSFVTVWLLLMEVARGGGGGNIFTMLPYCGCRVEYYHKAVELLYV